MSTDSGRNSAFRKVLGTCSAVAGASDSQIHGPESPRRVGREDFGMNNDTVSCLHGNRKLSHDNIWGVLRIHQVSGAGSPVLIFHI